MGPVGRRGSLFRSSDYVISVTSLFLSLLLILRVSVKGNGGWRESHFAIVSDWDCHILRTIASAFQEEMLQLRNEVAASLWLFLVETRWYKKGAYTYDVQRYLIAGIPQKSRWVNNPLWDMRVRFLQTNVDIINHCPYLTLASSVSWILSRTECRKDLIFCCPDRKREGAVIQMSNVRIVSGDFRSYCSNQPNPHSRERKEPWWDCRSCKKEKHAPTHHPPTPFCSPLHYCYRVKC